MTLDSKASTVQAKCITEVIQAIASDAAHDILFDLGPSLRDQIPDDLPIEVWRMLCDDVQADLGSLIKTRLQWLIHSCHAEAKEIREFQQQQALWEAQQQAQQEVQTLKAQPLPEPVAPKIRFINSSKSTPPPEPASFNPTQVQTGRLDQTNNAETKPQRLRRRSAASIAI